MILDDPYLDAQWLRTAGHSSAGGAELGECLAVGCPRSSRASSPTDEVVLDWLDGVLGVARPAVE